MDLISDLLLLPITGPVRGLKALLGAIRDEADATTRYDAARARAELSDLELRRDLGEISEEEYQEQENILLERLNATLNREELWRDEPPDASDGATVYDGEVVDDVVDEVVGFEGENGGSGYVEYVDGEYEYDDEDDEAEQSGGSRR